MPKPARSQGRSLDPASAVTEGIAGNGEPREGSHMEIRRAGRKVLFDRIHVCDSLLAKAVGLMGRMEPLAPKECLLFVWDSEGAPIERSIHMSFCFFPIRAIWLDGAGRVIDTKTAYPAKLLEPATWKTYSPKAASKYLIECSASVKVKIGEKLRFIL